MSHVIDQMCDDEHLILDSAAINAAYSAYHKRMGEYPAPDEELTAKQITALYTRFREGQPPTSTSRCGDHTASAS